MRAVYVRSLLILAWLAAFALCSLLASGRPGAGAVAVAPAAAIGASHGQR
jgi:hypothetical protein